MNVVAGWQVVPKSFNPKPEAMAGDGMQPFWAETSGTGHNPAPIIAWVTTLVICLGAVKLGYVGIYFASLPGWFIATVLYLLLSHFIQRRTQTMRVQTS